jgi:hypothetical protein
MVVVLLVERLQGSRFFLLSIGTADLGRDSIPVRRHFFSGMSQLFGPIIASFSGDGDRVEGRAVGRDEKIRWRHSGLTGGSVTGRNTTTSANML